MERQDAAARVRTLEQALLARPLELALHQQLEGALRAVWDTEDRVAQLAAICDDLPAAFTSQLLLARARDVAGDLRGAIVGYLRAIKTAQMRGFWYDEGSTPPWLHEVVLLAMRAAETGRERVFDEIITPLIAKYGEDELGRVTSALAMYLGVEPTVYTDPRQKPRFLYIPELPIAPVFAREALTFADWYEAQTPAILAEVRQILDGERGVQPFHYDVPEAKRGELVTGTWDAYFFYEDGERAEAHHAACPKTSEVLATLPLDHVRDHGPEVCFSIMRPGAHILPHRGVTNARSVLHLGLEIPGGCALDLPGITQVEWQAGKCFAFDDTYEHQAWNRSDVRRVVLLADIWNPYLRPAEREALAVVVAAIGDFNRDSAAR